MRPYALLCVFAIVACGGEAPAPRPPAPPPPPTQTAAPPQAPPAPLPPRADANLLKRSVLFGPPDRRNVRLSPDGTKLAWLAPVEGILNVWVAPAEDPGAAKPVTKEAKRPIRELTWAYTNQHILYPQDAGGDENWHVFAVDLKSGETKDLTPIPKVAAHIENVSSKLPGEVVLGLNDRDEKFHDLYRVDVKTGQKKLIQKNDGYIGFAVDDDYKVRLAFKPQADASIDILEPGGKDGWKPWGKIPHEDSQTTNPLGFDTAGRTLYMTDSRERDTAALVAVDPATKKATVLGEDPKADVRGVTAQPRTGRPQAFQAEYDRTRWVVLDKALQPDFDYLKTVADGDLQITSRSLDDKRWVVAYTFSDGPTKYYRYDRAKEKKATFLFTQQKALEGLPLVKMKPELIPSRDGLTLVSYLTLPRGVDADGDGKPQAPLPTVLFVHGGPWARDSFGYSGWDQWLANRGYAVLSVNYRGSTGFGKKFVNAGDKEWAAKMHDDLIDAVRWAVKAGIADEHKVAIMGGSYGGYATLVGLTFTPDTFTCGVDIVGPSNLVTLLSTIPPYWAAEIEDMTKRIGDHRTEDGKKFLLERSPLTHVQAIQKPLLIGQGANDPRVKQAESDQIVKAMQAKGLPVTYVLFPDEGHGFARPVNTQAFNYVAETFLAQCLGGAYEPFSDDLKASSMTVPAGADQIYGLPEAMKSIK